MSAPPVFHTHFGQTGPRVVFLHGLFGQGKNWTMFAKALATEARVTLVDLPNHGRSGWTETFSYPDMADQVAELMQADVGQGEPAEAYAVVGHSMGGKVAMALALRHPGQVSGLAVVDVSPVATTQVSGFADYVRGMRALDLTSLVDRVAADAQLRPYVASPTIRGFLLQNLRREPGTGWRWQMNLELLGSHLDDVGNWPAMPGSTFPGSTLWLAGADSTYVRRDYAPAMRALFPRVQLVTVKGAGHWVHTDQPEVFLAAIRRLLHLDLTADPNDYPSRKTTRG